MEATVRATCPRCKTVLRIPAQWVGQAVKCKKCGALIRSKAKADDDTPHTAQAHGTAPAAPLTTPQPNAFDFNQPAAAAVDDDLSWLPQPAPAPAAVPAPPLDANGYPLPHGSYPPPGYPSAPPPGYPYPVPPGYAPPAPPAGYPYPAPPGYPQPAPYGYAPPPGYGYPQPVPGPAPVPVPAAVPTPVQSAPPVGPSDPPSPFQPANTNGKATRNAAKGRAGNAASPQPQTDAFEMDPAGSTATAAYSSRARAARRGKGKSKGKSLWIGLCLLMTAGLVAGGIVGGKYLQDKFGNKDEKKDPAEAKTDPNGSGGATAGPGGGDKKAAITAFPRRLLFISITKYMYLNPLTQAQPGAPDRIKPAALRLAFDWRVPTDPTNNQVFVLSDTTNGPDARLPMKGVVQDSCQEFFNTSRAQDRIVVYFGGHAIEKDGKAYLAPMEAELDGDDWEKSVIPLGQFYDEMQKCKATQKVVIWDVCRYNPEKGRVRPGSEPMSEGLYKALTSPPAGIQVVTTCKPGENALEFTALRPDGFSGPVYSGSSFLEAMKFVADPRNNPKARTTPAATDPLPVTEWAKAIEKRTVVMSQLAEKSGSGGQQSVALSGAAPATLTPPNPEEKAAARFEFPQPPKGASQAEIKSVEREFYLPPIKPGLGEVGLADFPFPADVMKPYESDGVALDVILKNKEKYRFRAAVLDALEKIREKWTMGAGALKIRSSVEGPLNDKIKKEVKEEQNFWARGSADLELCLFSLETVAPMRDMEPKRWQAHYDFAVASVKARLAYMNEYNKLLGNLITETLPVLDPKLGQDGYVLVASETLKSGKEVKKWADEAQTLFQEITTKYKGTPWAIQAKQEKSVTIGLNWKAASLKKE